MIFPEDSKHNLEIFKKYPGEKCQEMTVFVIIFMCWGKLNDNCWVDLSIKPFPP